MKNWRRFLAALLTVAMLAPMAAIGEGAEALAIDVESAIAETEAIEAVGADAAEPQPEAAEGPVAQSQPVEAAAEEMTLTIGEGGAVENEEAVAPQFYDRTIDPAEKKAPTFTVSLGDTLRLRVKGATGAAWKPGKAGYVTIAPGSDEAGSYVDIKADREIKKLKLTATLTGASKKKATATLVIQNPWQPRGLSFVGLPAYIPAGSALDLGPYLALEPDYARTSLTWKCSGAGKLDKGTSLLRATKAGKAKITVTTANKLKLTHTLEVRANKAQYAYGKPAAGDIAKVSGGWTLWPVSVEPAKKGGLLCQFYLLNGTGDKVTKIENLTLSVAAGTRDSLIAEGRNMTVKAAVGKGKAKVVKITLPTTAGFDGVFLPDHQRDHTLFFNINQGGARLNSKTGSYDFIYTPKYPAPQPVQSLALSQDQATLRVGESLTLTAEIQPADAENPEILWSSDDESVAAVSGGTVTAVGAGRATITARAADGGAQASCAVTVAAGDDPVIPVSGISLSAETLTLSVGETRTLTADVQPADATNPEILWSSDDESVAAVSDGAVTAVGAGRATITARAAEGGAQASCAVTVAGEPADLIPVTAISLDQTSIALVAGSQQTLVAEVLPGNAANRAIRWWSDNPAVASVLDGTVTAVGGGFATVTAEAADGSGASATCAVAVTVPVSEIRLSQDRAEIPVGGALSLTAEVLPEGATNRAVEWHSDNEAVAVVEDGQVTVVGEGEAGITAVAADGSGASAACAVVGLPAPSDSDFIIVDGVVTGYRGGGGGAIEIPAQDENGQPVTAIGAEAFAGCAAITEVELGQSIAQIGDRAFWGCTSLSSIAVPRQVTAIGVQAFDPATVVLCELDSPACDYARRSGQPFRISGSYGLDGLTVVNGALNVSVVNDCACRLSVTLLSEDQSEILAQFAVDIEAHPIYDGLTLNLSDYGVTLPEYFVPSVTLLDAYGDELATPCVSTEYTRVYREFSEKTPEDFQDQVVLDLGGGDFGVISNSVVQATGSQSGSGYTVSADAPLQVGDSVYLADSNEMIKVKSLARNDDGTYIVQRDDDATLGDFYDYIRYREVFTADEEETVSNAPVKIQNLSALAISNRIGPFTATGKIEPKAYVSIDWDKETGYIELDVGLEGTGSVGIECSGEFEPDIASIDLANVEANIPTSVPGIECKTRIKVPLKFTAEASCSLEVPLTLKAGVKYNNIQNKIIPIKSMDVSPKLEITGKATASLSAEVEVGLGTLSALEKAASIGLNLMTFYKAGVKITATQTFVDLGSSDKKHMCKLCLAVEPKLFIEYGAELKLSLTKAVEQKAEWKKGIWEAPLGGGYLSLINDEDSVHKGKKVFKYGFPVQEECPNYQYRTQIMALDKDGLLVNVPVTIYRNSDGNSDSSSPVMKEAAKGTTSFTTYLYPGEYTAVAEFPYKEVSQEFVIFDEPLAFAIKSVTGAIAGQVTEEETGKALAGVTVSCEGADSATTDASGRYSLKEVPVGDVEVSFAKEGYSCDPLTAAVKKDTLTSLDAVMSRGKGAIAGRVTDEETGKALAGVSVSCEGADSVSTDENGDYKLVKVSAGERKVSFKKESYSCDPISVTVEADAEVPLNATMKGQFGAIAGRVTDQDTGKALAGVTVSCEGVDSVATDENGDYTLERVPVGRREVSFSKEGYGCDPVTVTVKEKQTAPANAAMSKETGAVAGRVTEEDTGKALAGVTVSCEGADSATTDASGEYRLEKVPTGKNTLSFSAEGYGKATLTVTVQADQVAPGDIALSSGMGTISGQVVNVYDEPLSGVTVSIEAYDSVTTGSDGRYTMKDVGMGKVTIRFSREGYQTVSYDVEVQKDADTPQDAVMEKSDGYVDVIGSVLHAYERNQDGRKLLSGVRVTCGDRAVTSIENGQYENYTIKDVPDGEVELTFSKSGYDSVTVKLRTKKNFVPSVSSVDMSPTSQRLHVGENSISINIGDDYYKGDVRFHYSFVPENSGFYTFNTTIYSGQPAYLSSFWCNAGGEDNYWNRGAGSSQWENKSHDLSRWGEGIDYEHNWNQNGDSLENTYYTSHSDESYADHTVIKLRVYLKKGVPYYPVFTTDRIVYGQKLTITEG